MKYVIRKAYFNYETEEKWLNEMSGRGMALTDYSWCRYVFEDTKSKEYIYRIELLKELPTHPESIAYIRFLEEMGIECVATYIRWVYLRKKASEGPFDLYTDIESKIKYYKTINGFWITMAWIELTIGLSNICIGISSTIGEKSLDFSSVNFFLGSFLIAMSILFFCLARPIGKKIKRLKQEQLLRE